MSIFNLNDRSEILAIKQSIEDGKETWFLFEGKLYQIFISGNIEGGYAYNIYTAQTLTDNDDLCEAIQDGGHCTSDNVMDAIFMAIDIDDFKDMG